MAEVNEQAGVSNCPIFNELDDKTAELLTLEQSENPDVSFLPCVLWNGNSNRNVDLTQVELEVG